MWEEAHYGDHRCGRSYHPWGCGVRIKKEAIMGMGGGHHKGWREYHVWSVVTYCCAYEMCVFICG